VTLFDDAPHQDVKRLVFQQRGASSTVRTSWMARASTSVSLPQIPAPPAIPLELSPETEVAPVATTPQAPLAPEAVYDTANLAALEQEVRKRMHEQAAMLGRLERSIEELAAVRASMMAESEKQLAELAGAIARKVLCHELATEPARILDLAREGIAALSERDQMVVRVGAPLNEATLSAFFETMKGRGNRCEVRHDPSLAPGQCIVETDLGRVDESMETRLGAVLEQLLPRPESSP